MDKHAEIERVRHNWVQFCLENEVSNGLIEYGIILIVQWNDSGSKAFDYLCRSILEYSGADFNKYSEGK